MALKLNMFTINQSLPTLAFPSMMNFSSPKVSMVSTLYSSTKEGENPKKSAMFAHKGNVEVARPMSPEKVEIFQSMEDWTRENILTLLKPVEKSWQPQDFLPDSASDGFIEQVNELRERTKDIPNDYFVILVGSVVTEEALPTYQTRFNSTDVFQDETGIDNTPWAIWNRAWSAEENRHGDLLNKYLYLSGRVDMKQVEKTIQYLIRSGMDLGTEKNPYLGMIYTSFQERATFISHGNIAKLAMKHGDRSLAQICGTIASDEKRHGIAYSKIVKKLFELDPSETVMAFAHMMRIKISMPGHLMYDGRDKNLFTHLSSVSSRIGAYSAMDYIDILEHLVAEWNVEKLTGLSTDGQQAQDYVCGLAQRIRRLEEKVQGRAKEAPNISFSWIFDKEV